MKRPVLLALAAVLLAALFAWLVEFRVEESPSAWSDQARTNPYLAAGRLLERRGYAVFFHDVCLTSPARDGALLLNQPPDSLPRDQQRMLLNWVEKGNLLLVAMARVDSRNAASDLILGPLGVQVERDENPESSALLKAITDSAHHGLPWLHVSDREGDLQAAFGFGIRLQDRYGRAVESMADPTGVRILRYEVGRGHVVALADSAWLRNGRINEGDHAALWLRLVDVPPGQEVHLIQDGGYPGIFNLMWRFAPYAVVALGLLVAGWVWRAGARFGPLRPGPEQPRRSLGEHLLASGRFLWHSGRYDRLYAAMRQGIRVRLFRRHPTWRHLDETALIQELARHTGLAEAEFQRALRDTPDHQLPRFLADMRVIQALRKLT